MNNTFSHRNFISTDGRIIGKKLQEEFVSVAAGTEHSLALTRTGRIFAWGNNESGQTNCPKGDYFVSIAAGVDHSLALSRTGAIFVSAADRRISRMMPDIHTKYDAISTSSGYYNHNLVLTRDGRVVGSGSNHYGEIECPPGNFVAVAAGRNHSLALTRDGRIIGWGYNGLGQTDCPQGNNFISVAAGDFHSLGLQADGNVVGWGDNEDGQTNCPQANNIIAIAASQDYSLALTNDGKIVRWGKKGTVPKEKVALPYDFLSRLNRKFKVLCPIPKYIKMEILEDYTEWQFRDLYYL